MIPMPNTRYGASKLKAEMWLEMDGMPYIIFRPTGIYGPRDHDYFLMFKSISSKGFDFSVGFRKQLLTFIYVEDLSRAVLTLLKAPVKETYDISEPRGYTEGISPAYSQGYRQEGRIPRSGCPCGESRLSLSSQRKIGVARMKPSTLNRDKYKIMKQRNWGVDVSKASRDFGFSPVSLADGISESIRWYREEGWI